MRDLLMLVLLFVVPIVLGNVLLIVVWARRRLHARALVRRLVAEAARDYAVVTEMRRRL